MKERRKNLNDKFGFVEIMEVSLNEIGEIITGNTPSKSDTNFWNSPDICFIKPDVIAEDEITELLDSNEYISENARKKARIVNENSILVTCIGSIAKIGIVKIRECAFNQQINAIIPNKNIDTKYLCYCLQNSKVKLKAIANAPVVPIINKKQFGEFVVKIDGDISTQKKIVNRLDYVQSVITLYKIQLQKFDDLIKARFIEMFGRPFINNMNWESRQIKNVVNEVKYGTSKPSVENGEYKYLRMNNLTYDGRFDLTDLKFISLDNDELEKCVVRKGDVLFNRTNSLDLIGKTADFDFDEDMVIAGYIIRIRLKETIVPKFFSMYMDTDEVKLHLRTIAKGAVNQANINAQELQGIPIYIPPIELQQQFADFVKQVDKSRFVELLQDHGIFDLGLNTDEMDTYYNEFLEQVQDQKQEVIDNQEIILTLQDTSLLNVFHEKTNEEIHNELEKEISEMFNGIEGEDASKLYDSLHNQIQYA